MKLNGLMYDILKWIVVICLPAIATCLSVLNAAWNWGLPIEAILTTFGAVETLIGALIGISTAQYNKDIH